MRHVAILIETSRAYGRGLLRGIARYNQQRGHWSTYFQPQGLGDPPPPWLAKWRGNGILARIDNRRLARSLTRTNVPVVNLRGNLPDLSFPFIGSNNEAIARLAADHLIQRGFRHLAFCGYRRGVHAKFDERGDYFERIVTQAGCSHSVMTNPAKASDWEREQARIGRWIRGLPKPVAVFAANDDRGLQVLDACRREQFLVPDHVAVLGVDNDEYLCGLSLPSLSSIDVNSEETGYRAAALLDRLMSGQSPPKRLPEIQPHGVVVRQSSDFLATDDAQVVRAARFIRDHACDGLQVQDVVREVRASRSSLEPRFRSVTGRTIHQQIRRVQLEVAQRLLTETDTPIKQVAQRCGFKNVQYFTRVFSAALDQTPAAFRRDRKRDVGL